MLLTILEAQVAPGRERALQDAFAALASGPIPRGLVRSELLRDSRDPTRWRLETLWYTRESLEAMRAAGTPAGVLMFRATGAEPTLSIHEMVDTIPIAHLLNRSPLVALETERLVLEPLTRSHAAELFPLLSDPRVFEFIPQDPPPSLQALEAAFERFERRLSPDGRQVHFDWAVRAKERGVCVGRVEATLNPDRWAYLAYMFGAEHWGRGFATEACRRVVDALFRDYGMEHITAEVDTRNEGSIRVLEHLGFHRGGTERCDHIFKGAQCYEITFSLRRP